jgi:hypothetical protein
MVSDLDIYRAASMLIVRHGADAVIEAARMIDRMLDHGDDEGRRVWRRIKRAIEALQAPPSGATHLIVRLAPQPALPDAGYRWS